MKGRLSEGTKATSVAVTRKLQWELDLSQVGYLVRRRGCHEVRFLSQRPMRKKIDRPDEAEVPSRSPCTILPRENKELQIYNSVSTQRQGVQGPWH